MPKIKISKQIFERVRNASKAAGYSSLEEFVQHALETRLEEIEQTDTDAAIDRQLQGLGYIE